MTGKITLINPKRGMAALITENDEYTSFDTRGCEIEVGDIISGDLESLGSETWTNETRGEIMEVFVEGVFDSRKTALRLVS
jgi:hypothetical protein